MFLFKNEEGLLERLKNEHWRTTYKVFAASCSKLSVLSCNFHFCLFEMHIYRSILYVVLNWTNLESTYKKVVTYLEDTYKYSSYIYFLKVVLQIVGFVLEFHFCLSRSTYKLFTYMCILIDKFGKVKIQNVKIRLFER